MIDQYFTYILASKRRGALFIGTTHELAQRVLDHKYHRIAGVTSWYNINQLVYYERHPDFEAAFAREQSLKALLREAKVQLIDAANPGWEDLYVAISRPATPPVARTAPDSDHSLKLLGDIA